MLSKASAWSEAKCSTAKRTEALHLTILCELPTVNTECQAYEEPSQT